MFAFSQKALSKITRQIDINSIPELVKFYSDNPHAGPQSGFDQVAIVLVEGELMPSGMQAYSVYFDGDEHGNIDVSIDDGTIAPIQPPGQPCIMISMPLCRDKQMLNTCIVHEMSHYLDKNKGTDPASDDYQESDSEAFARGQEKSFLEFIGLDEHEIGKFLAKKYGSPNN